MEATSSSSFKAKTAAELQAVKQQSGKTYGQIAEETGLTNVYVAQLLRGQAQLKPGTAPLLRDALPGLTDELLHEMMQPPLHSSDPNLIQEPTVYWQSRKNAPLHSENDTLSQSASQELSSFSRHINEQNAEGTSTARSIRVKEAKLKRNDEESTNITEVLREQNRKLIEFVKRKSEDMQHAHQIQIIRDQNRLKKLARGIYEDESKLLLKDLNSITDLNLRELFRKEQARIMQKRARQQDQRSQNSCSSYGQHFDELAGPRNDLPK